MLRTNLFLGKGEMGEEILKVLLGHNGIFVPEVFDTGSPDGRMLGFDANDLSLPLKTWAEGQHVLGIVAKRRKPLTVFFEVSATKFRMFDYVALNISLDRKGILDPVRVEFFNTNVGIEEYVNLAKSLYSVVKPNWGFISNDFCEHAIGTTLNADGNIVGYNPPDVRWSLMGLFWANFFGPEYVAMFSREKLLAAPCHKVEVLPDGGILLLLSESPFDASEPAYQAKKRELTDYLGPEVFNGSRLPQFRVGPGRKVRDARPTIETRGVLDDIFWHASGTRAA